VAASSNQRAVDDRMTSRPKRPAIAQKIEGFAKRRADAPYIDVSNAVQGRLRRLRDDFANVPPSYRGYLSVGICSCLESHMKYSYAAAAETFSQHPELLKILFKDITVDINAMIDTASKSFHLADVVAASITISTLASYRTHASNFFSALSDNASHDFPWDYVRIVKAGDPDRAKEFPVNLDRLERVFDARHKFIHETRLSPEDQSDLSDEDILGGASDAAWLISTFQMQFEHLGLWSKYTNIRDDEGLDDAVSRNLKEFDELFERIKSECDQMQYESLQKFRDAFLDYIWARCEFQASIYLPPSRWESAISDFLNLAPEYRATLEMIARKQKYALALWPIAKQRADLGIGIEDS
jgi:hypothetical protein